MLEHCSQQTCGDDLTVIYLLDRAQTVAQTLLFHHVKWAAEHIAAALGEQNYEKIILAATAEPDFYRHPDYNKIVAAIHLPVLQQPLTDSQLRDLGNTPQIKLLQSLQV